MSHRSESISQASPVSQKLVNDNFNDVEQFDQFADLEWSPPMFYRDSTTSVQDDITTSHEKHLLQSTDEFDLHDSKRQETGAEAEKKKPGRKPITNEPTTKRKAQNRAAQRAFRERKENHVKTLENRVAELEQQNNNKSAENQMLKAQIAQLQNGSQGVFATDKLFTFDCPAPQVARARSLEISPLASDNVPAVSACPSLYSSDSSPQTLPEKEFNAASMPNFYRDGSYQESHYSSNDSAVYTQSPSNGESDEKPTPVDPLDTDLSLLFSEPFANQPIQYGFDPMSYRDNNVYNSFEVDPPIFDNTDTFDLSKTYTDSSLDFLTLPSRGQIPPLQESHSGLRSEATVSTQSTDQPAVTIKKEAEVGCPEVWRKIVAHPKFASFDLDSLCSEFAKKTTCSGKPAWENKEKDWATFDKHLDDFAERTVSKSSAI